MVVVVSATVLDDLYKAEKDADVRERLLLIRRIKYDNKEAASVAENEFHRSRWWAYKWLNRFDEYCIIHIVSYHISSSGLIS